MTTRTITNEAERGLLLKFIGGHPLPFTAKVEKGRRRSVEQNKLNRMWMREIADQVPAGTWPWDDGQPWTEERARAFCKLHFGVPILRDENEYFREKYDRIIKPHDHMDKLEMMAEPLDFPVTRLMNTSQEARYLDEVHKYFAERGIALTLPETPHETE